MKKRKHLLHFFISLITSGLWLPVWWYVSGPGGKREIPVLIQRCVIGIFGFMIAISLFSYVYDEYKFRNNYSDLSIEQQALFNSLSIQHPRIIRENMVEAVRLPETLRNNYLESKIEQFKEEERQLRVRVAAEKAEQKRKDNSPANRFAECRYVAEQTIANKARLRTYMKAVCEPIMGHSLPEHWRTK